jgi:hypothetical protein
MLTVRVPGEARHGLGEEVPLILPVDLCHVFDRSGKALERA